MASSLVIGGVALFVGGGMAAGTAIGVVNTATGGKFEAPEGQQGQSILEYGQTSSQ